MPEKFIILDPTLEVEAPRVARAPRPASISTIGLLDNGKPNSDKVLKKVAALLAEQAPQLKINYYRKPGAYRPAPQVLLDQIVAECDAVLVGIGESFLPIIPSTEPSAIPNGYGYSPDGPSDEVVSNQLH